MTINDYDNVYKLWISTPGMGLNELDDSREGIEKYLERNPKTCFVALKGNTIVGAIISGHDGRRGYIYHTAVAISHRKQGIGKALINAVLKELSNERINKVALVVFSKNEIGNSFWEKCGFKTRDDLDYRNKNIKEFNRIDT